MSEPLIRVLYVDDDEALGRLVQKTLGRRGIEVVHAATTEEALKKISEDSSDVIALDHYLSNGTGMEFLAQLVANRVKPPPIVYVTGTSDMNVAVAALKGGASDFVVKTIGDEFLILLETALTQAVEQNRLRTAKKAAEQQVRLARDRAEALLTEVNHRVANSLALVSSLVTLQATAVADQVAKDALAETRARIYAISLVHKRLYSSGDVRVVELDGYLSSLLEHLETAMRSEGHRASLASDLAPIQLATDAAINLGVVVTEWVTNAYKYAYPDKPGEIRVILRPSQNATGELRVEDNGIGRSADAPSRGTGLGTRIVKAMAATMGGEIEYLDQRPGTAARLTFPLRV